MMLKLEKFLTLFIAIGAVAEVAARIIFAVVGVIHVMVIWKYLLPKYKESFNS